VTAPLAVSLETVNLLYAVAAVLLVFGIKQLSSPRTARQGNFVAAAGMAIAVGITLFHPDVEKYGLMAVGIAIGTVNVVGGFLVTDRMLHMFKGKRPEGPPEDDVP